MRYEIQHLEYADVEEYYNGNYDTVVIPLSASTYADAVEEMHHKGYWLLSELIEVR